MSLGPGLRLGNKTPTRQGRQGGNVKNTWAERQGDGPCKGLAADEAIKEDRLSPVGDLEPQGEGLLLKPMGSTSGFLNGTVPSSEG